MTVTRVQQEPRIKVTAVPEGPRQVALQPGPVITQLSGEPRRSAVRIEREGPRGLPGIDWRGTWSSGVAAYLKNDGVTLRGESYIARTAHVPSADNEPGKAANWYAFWDVLARKADGLMETPFGVPQSTLSPEDGVLTIDLAEANAFIVVLDQSVTQVNFTDWPVSGTSQRITLYVKQDATGGHSLDGWPIGMKWPDSSVPRVSQASFAVDCFVFESFTGGAEIYGNYVGRNYTTP